MLERSCTSWPRTHLVPMGRHCLFSSDWAQFWMILSIVALFQQYGLSPLPRMPCWVGFLKCPHSQVAVLLTAPCVYIEPPSPVTDATTDLFRERRHQTHLLSHANQTSRFLLVLCVHFCMRKNRGPQWHNACDGYFLLPNCPKLKILAMLGETLCRFLMFIWCSEDPRFES